MTDNRIVDAIKSADLIVRDLLNIQSGEEVALIGDPETDLRMMQAIMGVALARGAECTLTIMQTRPVEESLRMPAFIEAGMEAADVVIGMTRATAAACYSPTISRLRAAGRLRFFSMVLRDLEVWTKGGATADYHAILAHGKRLQAEWAKGTRIRVTCPRGTDLTAVIGGAAPFIEAGFSTEPGKTAAFSDGEVSQGPNEGTAEGVVVVDGPIAHIGQPAEPVRLEIRRGKVVRLDGDEKAVAKLQHILDTVEGADNFAEIGIGLNPKSLQNGDFEEEKKRLGTVHIAIGRNTGGYGGTVHAMVHLDMVINGASVETDAGVLLAEGKVQVL